ncbi:MAG: carboxylesterase/lipase family protein [Chloroflexi bacterium]|nr:carboxylesterase/lipase family protein [Chloroflexota bacterium]
MLMHQPWRRRDTVLYDERCAVVQTAAGTVRGYIRNGIYTFKGLPYGEAGGPAGRFMRATPPVPWQGVKACVQYGNISPQVPAGPTPPVGSNTGASDEDLLLLQRTGGRPVGEDCLVLNLWTPSRDPSAKMPVLVWLHGGGYGFGCGHDLVAYDGENLAHQGAVVITINHRLGLLGHFYLAELGDERYRDSGNIAALDQLLALAWVRENIANFGGDPDCVTIFGQSGGGGKVSTLMGMPAARGWFHRAIVQSGSMPAGVDATAATELAKAVLEELEIQPHALDKLHELPVDELLRAGFAAMKKRDVRPMMGFGPVVDGVNLPEVSFGEHAPECSRDVPLLVGTNYHEFTSGVDNPDAYSLCADELPDKLRERLGERTEEMLAASYEVFPDIVPFDRYALLSNWFRTLARKQAQLKAEQGDAPAYLYWFTWRTPILNGRPGAFHSAEISFAFDNADRYETYNGGGVEPRRLSAQMSAAWLAFARRGNPSHPNLPAWPEYDKKRAKVMVLDDPCRVETDPDTRLERAMAKSKEGR